MRGRTNIDGASFINGDIVQYEVAENNHIMAGDFVQKLDGYSGIEKNILSVGTINEQTVNIQVEFH